MESSSLTRNGTGPPALGTQSLNHWTTREFLRKVFFNEIFSEEASTHLLQNGQPWEWCSLLTDKCCSVTKSDVWFCDPVDYSMPASPILHCLPKSAQTHVHWVGDAIQPISSSVVPFSSCLQCFPASGSFLVSQFFASGGQSIGVSASASVLPMNIDFFRMDWLDLLAVQGTLKNLFQHHR